NDAAGLVSFRGFQLISAMTREFGYVATTETDLSQILVGEQLIGGQPALIGAISLETRPQNSDEACKNHDFLSNSPYVALQYKDEPRLPVDERVHVYHAILPQPRRSNS